MASTDHQSGFRYQTGQKPKKKNDIMEAFGGLFCAKLKDDSSEASGQLDVACLRQGKVAIYERRPGFWASTTPGLPGWILAPDLLGRRTPAWRSAPIP
ncbi:hypothetical protein ANCDUO_05882 [Ancylostoma duodenale]|uniref:Uncharacterized protein n=1 Tax=Ancylostoma duodenale TaxID=51022 RepID=A0A0C2D305_9BILA|nr:hypothetical protein ANCDUO_05882 [Ancylostoma duodenale]